MPTTPTYSLPYPALTDPPNVPGDMQALAEQTETTIASTDNDVSTLDGRVTTLETDTAFGAWQALSLLNGWTARSGYYTPSYRTIPGNRVELFGGLIDGTGDNSTILATLPTGYRPAADQPVSLLANNGHMYGAFVRTTGDIELFHAEGTSPSFSAVYFLSYFPLSV